MLRELLRGFGTFGQRTMDDHLGAYAATCAYFVMISFVPFVMLFAGITALLEMDTNSLLSALMGVVPSGLSGYVKTVIGEVQSKSYAFLSMSGILLVWSAAKLIHAITNGLNVISKVKETRGWFYLRIRSMFFVVLFVAAVVVVLIFSIQSQAIRRDLEQNSAQIAGILGFFIHFRVLVGFFALVVIFMCLYKFLPNCKYSFYSQFPGALIASLIWEFFSFILSVYYSNNRSFNTLYGSITSIILTMIWLYFCMFFLLIGAEVNRVIYENPDDNVIITAINLSRENSRKKREAIEADIARYTEEAALKKKEREESKIRTMTGIPYENVPDAKRQEDPTEELTADELSDITKEIADSVTRIRKEEAEIRESSEDE